MLYTNNEISAIGNIMVKNNLFDKYYLQKIGVFGSVARGEHSDDIDVLIEDDINYKDLISFKDELQVFLNKRIDVGIAKYANPIVLHRDMKEIIYVTKC